MERNEGETRLFHYLLLSSDGSWFGEGRTAVSKREQHQGGETLIPGFTADKPCDFTNSLDCFSALDFSSKGVELHHL